jgi:hypothetical protein
MDFKEMSAVSAVSTAGKRSMSFMESVLFEQNNPCFFYSISFRDMDNKCLDTFDGSKQLPNLVQGL